MDFALLIHDSQNNLITVSSSPVHPFKLQQLLPSETVKMKQDWQDSLPYRGDYFSRNSEVPLPVKPDNAQRALALHSDCASHLKEVSTPKEERASGH